MTTYAETIRKQAASQLDWILNVQRAGMGCSEALTRLNTTTARKLLGQMSSNAESIGQGNAGGFMVKAGKIIAEHCGASLECAVQSQKQLLASVDKAARVASTNSR